MAGSVLVVGFGVTGMAVARQLVHEGFQVIVVEDSPTDISRSEAATVGVELIEHPSGDRLTALVSGVETVVPSPGVPVSHGALQAARAAGVAVLSEVELGWERSRCPIVAVTGTNGKTTVTTLIHAMLECAGLRAVAAGNIGLPLIQAAVATPVPDVLVAEVSSFQLEFTDRFRPRVATWLNLAEDHLDWHPSLDDYAAAKARIWRSQGAGDTAVVNADDPAVLAAAAGVPAGVRRVTFGVSGDWRCEGGVLRTPDGSILAHVSELPRSLPHDLSNALAASAASVAAGGSVDGCRSVLMAFRGLPHRVELIGEARGVRYYDDSKATTPASVLAALAGFDSVVLIAGGRNKSLDLSVLAEGEDHVRAVVAIGEARAEIEAAFAGRRTVVGAASMEEAVDEAGRLARPGDAVLLSPGCASFDMYPNYGARGEHFASLVRARMEVAP